MTLERLQQFLEGEFERVDAEISRALDTKTELTREASQYVRAGRSKRLRPAMVLLACQACGYRGDGAPKIAAVMELIHQATLLHDDVIDKADTRHGRPSINQRWGDDVAILLADFFYSRAFGIALKALDPPLLTVITDVAAQMCEGEMFQIQRNGALLSADEYFYIIRCKTANLFSACLRLGSLLADAEPAVTEGLSEVGLNFGMAFQITDDTLDYTAEHSHWGKSVGADATGGKQTLPLIHTLDAASPEDRQALVDILNDGNDFKAIVEHVERYNGIQHSLDVARDYAGRARRSLECLAPSEATEHLSWLTQFVIDRAF